MKAVSIENNVTRVAFRGTIVLATIAALAACGPQPPSRVPGAPRRPPDEQFASGGGIALRLLSWQCVDGAHVVMIQRCYDGFPGGCDDWQIERSACGSVTPLEAKAIQERHPSAVARDLFWD